MFLKCILDRDSIDTNVIGNCKRKGIISLMQTTGQSTKSSPKNPRLESDRLCLSLGPAACWPVAVCKRLHSLSDRILMVTMKGVTLYLQCCCRNLCYKFSTGTVQEYPVNGRSDCFICLLSVTLGTKVGTKVRSLILNLCQAQQTVWV